MNSTLPFDPQTLPDLIDQGYIIKQVHPTLPLSIYNYTAQTQYQRFWNPATIGCRGLVLDDQYQPIGRPLPKFFNIQEHQGNLPDGIPSIYEKLDGSLIVLFHYAGDWRVASRGSFTSEQALKATAMLADYGAALVQLDPDYTYLLEVIYPTNRIVVDYGVQERLVMLAGVHRATGAELELGAIDWPDRAQTYIATDFTAWLKNLEETQQELANQEGFILKWPNGYRLKYKLEDYVRLHRILTRIQAKDIWECLAQNQNLDQFLESVPDEFYQWVKQVKAELEEQYRTIELACQSNFKELGDRKTTAAYFQTQPNAKILFLMLDQRDYSQAIWKLIKPDFQRPFRVDSEA